MIVADSGNVPARQQYKGEARVRTADWTVMAEKLGTSVSTVTWSVDSGTATITGEALASNVATALITTGSTGCALIKVVATMADGQIDNHYFKINVSEPSCVVSTNKY